jgi:hypothetical protein
LARPRFIMNRFRSLFLALIAPTSGLSSVADNCPAGPRLFWPAPGSSAPQADAGATSIARFDNGAANARIVRRRDRHRVGFQRFRGRFALIYR